MFYFEKRFNLFESSKQISGFTTASCAGHLVVSLGKALQNSSFVYLNPRIGTDNCLVAVLFLIGRKND